MSKIVAIHQPNFFPWLGYFDKIARSDTFILLDDVQFPKTGGVWSNRVKILFGDKARWITAPINRKFSGTRKINEIYFSSNNNWRDKILKTIEINYKKHLFFDETIKVISSLIMNEETNLSKYNINAIKTLAKAINLRTSSIVLSSSFNSNKIATLRLIDLIRKVGGQRYLCGGGSEGYQEDALFEQSKIELLYQKFKHPEYSQRDVSPFIEGLSIIDAAMNLGWDGVGELLYKENCNTKK